ncbi:toxin Cry1Ac domain D-VI-related protein [Listeria cornellensis]|uniref:Uncharacterized protein n=1 Tax=Listeria cornellensis FSL F6-0969 TaxID=1265820 RepID=W7BMT5_9LIST|nr:toxin Cry1Ac domain D-VI-related protein [Listeria cornellensis]EUJ24346.1 hypothetical protein PCORN_18691 [Listeria cornellensis FSL F6-0969]
MKKKILNITTATAILFSGPMGMISINSKAGHAYEVTQNAVNNFQKMIDSVSIDTGGKLNVIFANDDFKDYTVTINKNGAYLAGMDGPATKKVPWYSTLEDRTWITNADRTFTADDEYEIVFRQEGVVVGSVNIMDLMIDSVTIDADNRLNVKFLNENFKKYTIVVNKNGVYQAGIDGPVTKKQAWYSTLTDKTWVTNADRTFTTDDAYQIVLTLDGEIKGIFSKDGFTDGKVLKNAKDAVNGLFTADNPANDIKVNLTQANIDNATTLLNLVTDATEKKEITN